MDQTFKKGSALALAGALAAMLGTTTLSQSVQAEEFEQCYGISKAGENDCAAEGNNSCAGTSKVDFDGLAWKQVAKGTCTTMTVTLPDGTTRAGSLTPITG